MSSTKEHHPASNAQPLSRSPLVELVANGKVESIVLAAEKAGRLTLPVPILEDDELSAPISADDVLSLDAAPLTPTVRGFTLLPDCWHGGQATVFKAIQQATGRIVAVKVITGGSFISSNQRARFDLETKLLSKIDHPNVVKIVDRGRTADGAFFFAMDFIEGMSLEDYWRDILWPDPDGLNKLLKLFCDLLGVFEHVHERGIVHRDIKPSNIRIDESSGLHILDFGLARLFEEDEVEPSRQLTVSGQLIGSIAWASPEHVAATRSRRVDERSDVYALGLLLFKALTGRFPYNTSGTIPEVAQQIARCKPYVPSRVSNAQIKWGDQLDATLDGIVLKALAKAQQNRYASASAFKETIYAYLAGKRDPRFRLGHLFSLMLPMATIAVVGIVWFMRMQAKMPAMDTKVIVLPSFTNGLGMKLVKIPAGTFLAGSPTFEQGHWDGEQQHSVSITHDFYIGTTEVTRGQFQKIMMDGKLSDRNADNLPVDGVSEDDAEEFCRRISKRESKNYRLPTPEEWEYSCRAGTSTAFNASGDIDADAWYVANSAHKLHEVGLKQPNAWGLYDMHGNVGEWCLFGSSAKTIESGRAADISHSAAICGGSIEDRAVDCRSASRFFEVKSSKPAFCGFRVVEEN